jgi:hypothetical protein
MAYLHPMSQVTFMHRQQKACQAVLTERRAGYRCRPGSAAAYGDGYGGFVQRVPPDAEISRRLLTMDNAMRAEASRLQHQSASTAASQARRSQLRAKGASQAAEKEHSNRVAETCMLQGMVTQHHKEARLRLAREHAAKVAKTAAARARERHADTQDIRADAADHNSAMHNIRERAMQHQTTPAHLIPGRVV